MANYVLSDIHGNKEAFDSILKQINLKETDDLYILGDVIDRHPHGIELLKQIMDMPNAHMLLGNHEYMMLNVLDGKGEDLDLEALDLWDYNCGMVTMEAFLREKRKTKDKIIQYLRNLPLEYWVTTPDGTRVQMVHAAPPELYEDYKIRWKSQLEFTVWDRDAIWDEVLQKKLDHVVVFGHTTTNHFRYLTDKMNAIFQAGSGIAIDCGAGWPDSYPGGRLACVRLDDGRVFYSKYDKPRKKAPAKRAVAKQ